MTTETYSFQLGQFRCLAINDGYIDTIPAKEFFAGAPPSELQAAFDRHGITRHTLRIPVTILYVDTGEHRVLIDTGSGPYMHPGTGLLIAGLQAEGITPEQIDTVALSHGHWDHICGNTGADGRPAFPRARYVMAEREYHYWLDQYQTDHTSPIYQNLDAIKDRVDLIGPDDEIVPGVRAVFAPGHTDYHTAFALTSGGETLYCLIDVVDHPLHFEHITWRPTWDTQPEQTVRTRRDLFGRAGRESALVHGFHLPFPGLGRLAETGADAWRYEPVGK